MPLPTTKERDHLVVLYERTLSAQDDYRQAIEAVAGRTGRSPSALRKWVRALARDEAEKVRGETQEMLDLFDAEAGGRYRVCSGEDMTTVTVINPNPVGGGRMRHDWAGHG